MEAIVLAGGLGTRLRSVLPDTPKPMAPICGKPFLAILLENLARQGFSRVVLSVGYKADVIQAYFGDVYAGLVLRYEVETEPLGTGGALRKALGQIQGDHAFVFNGDTFLDLEVDAVAALWGRYRQPVIVAREVDDVSRYGQGFLENGRGRTFGEKSGVGAGLINAGCYVLPVDAFANIAVPAPFSLEHTVLAPWVASGCVRGHVTRGLFIDIGIPSDYARAQTLLGES